MADMDRTTGANAIQVWNVRKTLEFAKPKLVYGYANSKSVLIYGNSECHSQQL